MNVNISSNFPANSTTTDSDAISHEALIKTFAILSINVVWLLNSKRYRRYFRRFQTFTFLKYYSLKGDSVNLSLKEHLRRAEQLVNRGTHGKLRVGVSAGMHV